MSKKFELNTTPGLYPTVVCLDMPPQKVTSNPTLMLIETPSSLPILDSSSDQENPDMITGVGPAKNESSSAGLEDVTTQPVIVIYPTGNQKSLAPSLARVSPEAFLI